MGYYGWEPNSYWDKELEIDGGPCPECGEESGDQSVYGDGRFYTGTVECQECEHKWEIDYEHDPY